MLTDIKYGINDVAQVAQEYFFPLLRPGTVFLFIGDLGAGKTFLTGEIMRQFFGVDKISSPTFCYVNRYDVKAGTIERVYHFDLYRLEQVRDFYNLELDSYFERKNAVFFVEWPEILLEEKAFLQSLESDIFVCKIEYSTQDEQAGDRRLTLKRF